MNKVFWCCIFFLLGSALTAQENLEEALANVASQNGLVGLSVVLTCGQNIQDVYHYGLRDIQMQLPIDDGTRYRIASISKTVTAIGLMKLFDEGLFELDEDVSDYLGFELRHPDFPEVSITFRHLLTHQSGVLDGSGYFNFLSATYLQTPTPSIDALMLPGGNYYTTNIWGNHAPGTYFQYSNLNFGIIATLIESISQMRFDEYMRTAVLEPLNIEGSYNVQDIEAIDNVAVLYRNAFPESDNYQGSPPTPLDLSNYEIGTNGIIFAPQGGLRVSPIELSRIMRMLANEGSFEGVTILSPETVAMMLENEWFYNGTNGDNYYNLFNSWGLGIQRTVNFPNGDIVIPGTTCYGHAGEAYGLISDMYFSPEYDFGIIFITNGYYGSSNYDFGNSSAFYVPEEQAYEAINDLALPICQETVGLNSIPHAPVSFFPNPAIDQISIKARENIIQLRFTNVLGHTIVLPMNSGQVNLEGIHSGVYTLSVNVNGNWQYVGRLMVL
jgi:CubicO group peptidase (beta-lactamase class C family)